MPQEFNSGNDETTCTFLGTSNDIAEEIGGKARYIGKINQ
jgi:hypothetical protein